MASQTKRFASPCITLRALEWCCRILGGMGVAIAIVAIHLTYLDSVYCIICMRDISRKQQARGSLQCRVTQLQTHNIPVDIQNLLPTLMANSREVLTQKNHFKRFLECQGVLSAIDPPAVSKETCYTTNLLDKSLLQGAVSTLQLF